MKSIYYSKSLVDTIKLGFKLGQTLRPGDVVLLYGDLGAGKTHFVKGVAEALQIDRLIKSPTFAYVHTYPVGGYELYHYDLYRLNVNDDLTSLGYEESIDNPNAINVVEWADRLGLNLPYRYIRVDILSDGDFRSIGVEWVYPERANEAVVDSFYDEWQTPLHVRNHCRQVANVALQLAGSHMEQFAMIDLDLLNTACLLHDMARVCDFNELNRDKFSEEVTNDKWLKWSALREQYSGQHHADVASNWLLDRKFSDTAEIIRLHKARNIVDEFGAFDSLEKMILFYADKRVRHDQIVPLKDRFIDFKQRYGQENSPDEQLIYDEVERRTFDLEKVLFAEIDANPEDVQL